MKKWQLYHTKKSKFVIFFSLWLIITLELIIRTAYFELLKINYPEPNWINDTTIGYIPKPNTKFKLVAPNINKEILVNKYGFYGHDIKIHKQKGWYRIAVVGDSYETGHLNENGESYISLCNKEFLSKNQKIECLNFSIDGKNRDLTKIKLIQEKILKFKPDMIILKVELPFQEKKTAKTYYKGYVLDYELNNKMSEQQAKDFIDELSSIKLITLFFNVSYIFRGISLMIKAEDTPPFNSIWNKLYVYKNREFLVNDIACHVYSQTQSISIINSLNYELKAKGIKLCLLSNTNDKKLHLDEDISVISLNSYNFQQYQGLLSKKYFTKRETKTLSDELYSTLVKSYIPLKFVPK